MAAIARSLLLLALLASADAFELFGDDDSPPPDVSKVGVDAVVQWASDRASKAAQSFASAGLSRKPSPDWRGRIVYEIQVDRFNNGDLSNDDLNVQEQQKAHQNLPNPVGLDDYRHGGDLQGILDRLDYLKDLGVDTLWITPVASNDGSYHGYCVTGPHDIDVGFGTLELYRKLVQEAHRRDMYVVQDIVINHLCDSATSYSTPPRDHEACAKDLNDKYWSGTPGGSSNQGELAFSSNFFPPLRSQDFFSRCGANSGGDTGGEGPAAVYGDFVSTMFDYDARNYDFQRIFLQVHKFLIAHSDIDGYRLDAAKHVPEGFLADFSTNIRAYAKSLGKSDFYVVGEVAASSDWIGRRLGKMYSNPNNPDDHGNVPVSLTTKIKQLKSTYLANAAAPFPGLNAVYDFAESGTSRDVLLGNRASSDIAKYYDSTGYKTIAAQADPMLSWTHLAIHDWRRFLHDDPKDPMKAAAGIAYRMSAPEMPILYYGVEQGFNGRCDGIQMNAGTANQGLQSDCNAVTDAVNRQDMFIGSPWRLGSSVPEINGLAYIGVWKAQPSPHWTQDPFLNRGHQLYQYMRRLTHIRQSCSALTHGQMIWRDAEPSRGGLLVFSRVLNSIEVLVIINPGIPVRYLDKYAINSGSLQGSGERWHNLMNGLEVAYTGYEGSNPFLYFSSAAIGNDGFQLWVSERYLGDYDPDLGCNLCKQ